MADDDGVSPISHLNLSNATIVVMNCPCFTENTSNLSLVRIVPTCVTYLSQKP